MSSKHSLFTSLVALALWTGLQASSFAVDAAAYMIMDSTTGHVLGAQSPNKKVQVGSLTKIATASVVLDWAELNKTDLNQLATVPTGSTNVAGLNPAGLLPGDKVSLRDLLYAALLQSDNIAACTLADFVGQSLEGGAPNMAPSDRFVAHMNALARKLDMRNTLFLNPHGLEHMESKLPYSTASDMARLASYAMAKSSFRFIVSQKSRRITIRHASTETTDYLLQNTNEMLGTNGIDGVKTGRTARAGECVIISSARQPESRQEGQTYIVTPRRLIVVVLGSTQRFEAAGGLLAEGWQLYDQWAAAGRPMKKGEGL